MYARSVSQKIQNECVEFTRSCCTKSSYGKKNEDLVGNTGKAEHNIKI